MRSPSLTSLGVGKSAIAKVFAVFGEGNKNEYFCDGSVILTVTDSVHRGTMDAVPSVLHIA